MIFWTRHLLAEKKQNQFWCFLMRELLISINTIKIFHAVVHNMHLPKFACCPAWLSTLAVRYSWWSVCAVNVVFISKLCVSRTVTWLLSPVISLVRVSIIPVFSDTFWDNWMNLVSTSWNTEHHTVTNQTSKCKKILFVFQHFLSNHLNFRGQPPRHFLYFVLKCDLSPGTTFILILSFP